MNLKRQIPLLITFVTLIYSKAEAQGKFKAGLGYNLVSNNFEQQHLETYGAPSIHFSYTFLRKSRFSLGLESATSLRLTEEINIKKFGFTSSLPLMLQLDMNKMNVYVGGGPTCLKQRAKTIEYDEAVSEYYLGTTIGVGIPVKQIFGDLLYFELNPRILYLKSFKNERLDAGMLSLVVFLRSS